MHVAPLDIWGCRLKHEWIKLQGLEHRMGREQMMGIRINLGAHVGCVSQTFIGSSPPNVGGLEQVTCMEDNTHDPQGTA